MRKYHWKYRIPTISCCHQSFWSVGLWDKNIQSNDFALFLSLGMLWIVSQLATYLKRGQNQRPCTLCWQTTWTLNQMGRLGQIQMRLTKWAQYLVPQVLGPLYTLSPDSQASICGQMWNRSVEQGFCIFFKVSPLSNISCIWTFSNILQIVL